MHARAASRPFLTFAWGSMNKQGQFQFTDWTVTKLCNAAPFLHTFGQVAVSSHVHAQKKMCMLTCLPKGAKNKAS